MLKRGKIFVISSIFILNLTNFITATEVTHVNIKLKNITCERNPTYVTEITCEIKPTSDGHGNLTLFGVAKSPIDDIWLRIGIYFYKQKSFRKSVIDYDGDLCALFSGRSTSGLFLAKAIKAINSKVPGLVHPCPYSGTVGFKNRKASRILNGAFPKVIPNGLYKLIIRIHKKNNATIAAFQVMAQIDVD